MTVSSLKIPTFCELPRFPRRWDPSGALDLLDESLKLTDDCLSKVLDLVVLCPNSAVTLILVFHNEGSGDSRTRLGVDGSSPDPATVHVSKLQRSSHASV